MARPRGIASKVAEQTGLSIRTVQRALAKAPIPETDDEKLLRHFMERLRGFASFCRETDPAQVGALHVTEDQAEKLREWHGTVTTWFQRFSEIDGN